MAVSRPKDYMQRCLDLASLGLGSAAPNPLVGSVIVHQDRIIGEGFHQRVGEAHAEVNAVRSVKNRELLSKSTLYVNLEPCAHHGRTPPCADLIIKNGIPEVVIGCRDPFVEVDGKGIEKLKNAGVRVQVGVLEQAARNLNKRFFTFHERKRPYVILKWAQTADGFLDHHRTPDQPALRITSAQANQRAHRWRSEEAAILVGSGTARLDNPTLNVRHWTGPDPLRLVVDRSGSLPKDLNLWKGPQPTWHLSSQSLGLEHVRELELDSQASVDDMLQLLHREQVQSVFVEGGASMLQAFLEAGFWDECRVFRSNKTIGAGVQAPELPAAANLTENLGPDDLLTCINV